ncbi:MAG: DUF4421 domain-containing protein [Bacteriovoracaceae bacterium]|nr:DUF4421 domain-containing protein [Bacteriovoracaceae bacterium]
MKLLIYIGFLVFARLAFAGKEFIHSASLSVSQISSVSELQDSDKKKAFSFSPNVPSGTGIGLETKYVTVGYVFAGKEAQISNVEKSKFRDLRLNFYYGHFDVRLNYQYYKGAVVNAGGLKKFYNDYEVKGRNGRAHYYFNKEILKYTRDGRELTRKAALNEGFNRMGSWFLGFNVDSRTISLPTTLASEHQTILTQKNITYHPSFNAFTLGPLIGYDFFALWSSTFFRAKLAGGPGFQTKGGLAEQAEVAFSLGIAFKKNHSLTVGLDSYIMTFKDENELISNTNTQGGLVYNYAF